MRTGENYFHISSEVFPWLHDPSFFIIIVFLDMLSKHSVFLPACFKHGTTLPNLFVVKIFTFKEPP